LKGKAMIRHNWRPAVGTDVQDIVNMAEQHFQIEIDTIFRPEPIAYSRNITFAVVTQFYQPNTELLYVARDGNQALLAYTWARAGERAPWSDDQMIAVRMAHVRMDLSAKLRVELVKDMIEIWQIFAQQIQCPVICSTTMRRDQEGFLKLHAKAGFDVRGSYAYKRVELSTT
jgi:hypothetical protein